MEDLEVFVYGMAKKDAMVEMAQSLNKDELLQDDRNEVEADRLRREKQRDQLNKESADALVAQQLKLKNEFQLQQETMRN